MMTANMCNGLSLLGTVLACLGAVGCGSTGRTGENERQSAVADNGIPTQTTITGDYDSDDYKNVAHTGDGDDDDIHTPKDGDADSDNGSGSYYDRDDNPIRYFGRAADEQDRKAITALITRYYAVASAEDGATACSMIIASLARSVPQDLGGPSGPSYLRGRTCALVMSNIFRVNRKQLVSYFSALKVASVRVDGDRGLVVLSFKTAPGREIRVARELGLWKLEALLDEELP